MKTLQEYLNEKYPTRKDKEKVKIISDWTMNKERKEQGITELLEGGELDLSKFTNLEEIWIRPLGDLDDYFFETPSLDLRLTKIELGWKPKLRIVQLQRNALDSLDLFECPELIELHLSDNEFTSVDFLVALPLHPPKLEVLYLHNNNIEPTTLDFLKPFINLKECSLGISNIEKNKWNRFYGSLKPLENFIKLESLDIAGTDIDSGLEYLPSFLVSKLKDEILNQKYKKKGKGISRCNKDIIEYYFNCQPLRSEAKVKEIWDQLKLFNYDIENWQLNYLKKMFGESKMMEEFTKTFERLRIREHEKEEYKKGEWILHRIIKKTTEEKGLIRFDLDKKTNYNVIEAGFFGNSTGVGENSNYVHCISKPPYDSFEEGDYIEINLPWRSTGTLDEEKLRKSAANNKLKNLGKFIQDKIKLVIEKDQEIINLEEELQVEREEFEKALQKAQEWRERQLKEITDQKDKEIEELRKQLLKLKLKSEQQNLIEVMPK